MLINLLGREMSLKNARQWGSFWIESASALSLTKKHCFFEGSLRTNNEAIFDTEVKNHANK